MGSISPAPEIPAQHVHGLNYIGPAAPNLSFGNPTDPVALEIILRHMVLGTFSKLTPTARMILTALCAIGTTKKNSTSVFAAIRAADLPQWTGCSNGAVRPALRELEQLELVDRERAEDTLRHDYEVKMPEVKGLTQLSLANLQEKRMPLGTEQTLFGKRSLDPSVIAPEFGAPKSGAKEGIVPESGAPESGTMVMQPRIAPEFGAPESGAKVRGNSDVASVGAGACAGAGAPAVVVVVDVVALGEELKNPQRATTTTAEAEKNEADEKTGEEDEEELENQLQNLSAERRLAMGYLSSAGVPKFQAVAILKDPRIRISDSRICPIIDRIMSTVDWRNADSPGRWWRWALRNHQVIGPDPARTKIAQDLRGARRESQPTVAAAQRIVNFNERGRQLINRLDGDAAKLAAIKNDLIDHLKSIGRSPDAEKVAGQNPSPFNSHFVFLLGMHATHAPGKWLGAEVVGV